MKRMPNNNESLLLNPGGYLCSKSSKVAPLLRGLLLSRHGNQPSLANESGNMRVRKHGGVEMTMYRLTGSQS